MTYYLLVLVFVLAVIEWVGEEKDLRVVIWISKPAMMVALIAWMLVNGAWQGGLLWFVIGLIFSLAGDIFLMWADRYFIPGLVSFLLAHVAYIIGFNSLVPAVNWIGWLLLMIVVVVAWQIHLRLIKGLEAKNLLSLKAPITIYAAVISMMLYSALLCFFRAEWSITHAILASAGAAFFFFSDTMIAWSRFIKPLPHARLVIMITYHLGQIAIATSALLTFS